MHFSKNKVTNTSMPTGYNMFVDVMLIPKNKRRRSDYYHLERENICKLLKQGFNIPLVALYDTVFNFKGFCCSRSMLEAHDYKYFKHEQCVLDEYSDGQFHLTFERKSSKGEYLEMQLNWDDIFYGFAYNRIKFKNVDRKENLVQYLYY